MKITDYEVIRLYNNEEYRREFEKGTEALKNLLECITTVKYIEENWAGVETVQGVFDIVNTHTEEINRKYTTENPDIETLEM